MNFMNLILASKSPYRRAQLKQLGLTFTCSPSMVDENQLKATTKDPRELCESLSHLKAQAVFEKNPKAIVIGSDQLVHFEGEILGKAGSLDAAARQLYKMAGKTHELLTGLCMISKDMSLTYVNTTKLSMRNLTLQECMNYCELDNPIDCAGSYKIECAGIRLFESIQTDDFSSIQGLPLMKVTEFLRKLNYPLDF